QDLFCRFRKLDRFFSIENPAICTSSKGESKKCSSYPLHCCSYLQLSDTSASSCDNCRREGMNLKRKVADWLNRGLARGGIGQSLRRDVASFLWAQLTRVGSTIHAAN